MHEEPIQNMDITDFKAITLNNKKEILSYTLKYAPRDCEFSFPNLFCWQSVQNTCFLIAEGMLAFRFCTKDNLYIYTLPIGSGDMDKMISILETDARTHQQPLRLQGELSVLKEILNPNLYEITPHRAFFDYIYFRKDLIELKGNTYQRKRNHINHFKKEFDYQYVDLTSEHMTDCLALEAKWRAEHEEEDQRSLTAEQIAMETAIRNFETLELKGGAILVNNEIIAFTFGAPINNDTFDIMIEKSDDKINGGFSIINQEFASHIPEQYTYINREEDLDMPGLRQSKLSYFPTILFEKSIATKIR